MGDYIIESILILKRTGIKQTFNANKIITSIENSANDCNFSLTQSDINLLEREIGTLISKLVIRKKSNIVSSLELKTIIYEVLDRNRFNKVAKAYIET